jgi:hypothetical protein
MIAGHSASRFGSSGGRYSNTVLYHCRTARKLWKARPVFTGLDELVMKNRGIRFEYVRSEGKLLMSTLRGLRILSTQ